MMLKDFKLLPQSDQVDLIYRHGVYIGKRKEEELIILLYQVEGFYVEVVYKRYRHKVISMRCSSSTSLIDPYLEQIDVEHLVS